MSLLSPSLLWSLYLYIVLCFFFFFNDTATTEIYTLSLHDALPISDRHPPPRGRHLGGSAFGDGARRGAATRGRRRLPPVVPAVADALGGATPRANRAAGGLLCAPVGVGSRPAARARRRAAPHAPASRREHGLRAQAEIGRAHV